MTTRLTAGQRALIEAALVQRQHELDARLAAQQGGQTRAEHAREFIETDSKEAAAREDERDVDRALTDLELRELGAVSDALRRLRGEDFGRCADCDAPIPFDRLKVEPWATRCVACASAAERQGRLAA
jgi:DnaK suppressor protein